ncbi:reverse transcriptase/maturase family protein [Blautia sp.]|uniref:reverse transcriptase/maturase family protein n=1 Tax=Blautia sp. TaxID=1955243 RepID=UPI002588DA13|nr:reverse transcriptase/maturase family protein [Blautia sp.]
MAKRVGNIYLPNCDYSNLYHAYRKAAKGKRYRGDVLQFTDNLEENLLSLLEELRNHTYTVGRYREFYIYEPKKRLIMALPFRDRVAQWWVYSILYPIFDKTFIEDSYACRKGKGQKLAADRLQYMLKQTEVLGGKWYYLKLDIAKYFYRIYHDKLLEIIKRKIKDKDMLLLLERIIKGDGSNCFGLSICDNVEDAVRLSDRGMPIGNLTSQLMANVYLNELDQFCKKVLGTKFYIRYMDDVIILSNSKAELHEIKKRIEDFLDKELQLTLNKKTCIRPVTMGVQFVGLHIWSTHRTVRKSTSLRIKRRLKVAAKRYEAGKITYESYNSTLQSYLGMLKHNDCYRFKLQLLRDTETIINNDVNGVAA